MNHFRGDPTLIQTITQQFPKSLLNNLTLTNLEQQTTQPKE